MLAVASAGYALLPTRRQCCGFAASAAAAAASAPCHAAVGSFFQSVPGSGTDGRVYGALKCSGSGTRAVVSCDPSLERIELALTMRCGHLFDPPRLEGLAHLAEHVTLAADPAALGGFIDDRVGALNAFTAEETTTFHLEFDMDEDTEPLTELRDVCERFAALFVSGTTSDPPDTAWRERARCPA